MKMRLLRFQIAAEEFAVAAEGWNRHASTLCGQNYTCSDTGYQ